MTALPRSSPWRARLPVLPKRLFEARDPASTLLVGWVTAFFPSVLLSFLVSQWLPALGQPKLPIDNVLAVFVVAVFAPIVETLIMAAVLALLLRLMPARVAVLVSALGWGIAHSLAAPAWGFVIWWPFLIFSILFVTWRQRSLIAGLAMPAAVHGLQNTIPALMVYFGTGG